LLITFTIFNILQNPYLFLFKI